jgi:hypothetical protein
LLLFCPLGSSRKTQQRIYSSFLQSIKTSRSSIFINSLILSEFANRFLRLDFDLLNQKEPKIKPNFKTDYVGTPRYKVTVRVLVSAINEILSCCEKGSDNFNAVKIDNILRHLQDIDFNDSYYIELSSLGNYKIVTDDNDFINYKNHNQEILTILKQ